MYTVMLRGVGAGLVSSSCTSGLEPPARHPSHNSDFGLIRTRCRLPGPPRKTRKAGPGSNRTPKGGVAAGAATSRWTRASRRRISPWSPLRGFCPRDRGTPTRAQHPYPGGVRGPSPRRPHHRPGRRRLSRPAPAAQRSHPVGPGQPCLGPAPARRDWPRETRGGRLGRRRTSEQDGPQPKSGYGTKPARRPRPRGKEAVPDGQGGRHRFLHPDPISGSNPPTRITAATGPPLKRPPGPGSHRDGPEACSPGEVRAGARSLDGRGRGESTITKYGSEHSLRVGHHVQGPGTEAPAAAAR
jgi:hypothetical protein